MADSLFHIVLQNFNEGNAPLASLDDKSFVGNGGQANDSKADLLTKPGFVTQAPGLVPLTNATQVGAVNELIQFILDIPTDVDTTFGVGPTNLFKISSTGIVTDSPWPQAITPMTDGQSVIVMNGNLFVFYNNNMTNLGDIAAMPLDTEIIDPTWGSETVSGGTPLVNAPHPTATKEDILLFGNGRYVGAYIEGLGTLNNQLLDFGAGAEVADIVFSANYWWIAVNYGVGGRVQAEIYMYDGSATSAIIADEVGVGLQRIGFLYVLNAQIYVCSEELSSDAFSLGFINGRQIKPLAYFSGSLPDHKQKTLYKNTLLFISDNEVWSVGAVVQQLPIQASKLSSGGYITVGAIASPFGVPMIASTDGSNYQLAQFSGYTTDSFWKSIYMDTTNQRDLGKITDVIVTTKALAANARADITIEGNQSSIFSNVLTITGTGLTRFVFRSISLDRVADIRVAIDYSNGDTTNDCPIRKIEIGGMQIKE